MNERSAVTSKARKGTTKLDIGTLQRRTYTICGRLKRSMHSAFHLFSLIPRRSRFLRNGKTKVGAEFAQGFLRQGQAEPLAAGVRAMQHPGSRASGGGCTGTRYAREVHLRHLLVFWGEEERYLWPAQRMVAAQNFYTANRS